MKFEIKNYFSSGELKGTKPARSSNSIQEVAHRRGAIYSHEVKNSHHNAVMVVRSFVLVVSGQEATGHMKILAVCSDLMSNVTVVVTLKSLSLAFHH